MNIALLGYGKMGKKIAVLAEKMGYTIVSTSNSKNPARSLNLSVIDVCIDFSNPKTAFENIVHAMPICLRRFFMLCLRRLFMLLSNGIYTDSIH